MSSRNQQFSKVLWMVTICYIIFHWNACVYFLFSLAQGIESKSCLSLFFLRAFFSLPEAEPTDFIFGYSKVFDVYVSDCPIFMATSHEVS